MTETASVAVMTAKGDNDFEKEKYILFNHTAHCNNVVIMQQFRCNRTQ